LSGIDFIRQKQPEKLKITHFFWRAIYDKACNSVNTTSSLFSL
jgi:hypothetical protein